MQLSALLEGVDTLEIIGADTPIERVCFDSRQAGPGTLYVAVPGTQVDGHSFIGKATAAGARAIVCEHLPITLDDNTVYIRVQSASHALGLVASNFYGRPSEHLALVGITGTNGKTTTVTVLHQLSERMGISAGLFSTVVNRIGQRPLDATHTTPDPLQLNALLREMVDAGCRRCFMEVSSHAITQNRIAGLRYAGGIFSNITPEHLDYHKSFDAYFCAKKQFFDSLPETAFALTNLDDPLAMAIVKDTPATVTTYAMQKQAEHTVAIIANRLEGLTVQLDRGRELSLRLCGRFNAYNALAVYVTSLLLGDNPDLVLRLLQDVEPVEGRFNKITGPDGIVGIVDFAHTPDAVANILGSIREAAAPGAHIITVIGCGGDRDRHKRPEMARLAVELSDFVILTSDNPRGEDPRAILAEMESGVPEAAKTRVGVLGDREEAIAKAVSLAHAGDIVLIAGKGHEKYQEIKGVKTPFDDLAVLRRYLLSDH